MNHAPWDLGRMEPSFQTSSDNQVRPVQGLLKIKLIIGIESSQSLGEILHHTEALKETHHWFVSFHQGYLGVFIVSHHIYTYSPGRQGALAGFIPSPKALCRKPKQRGPELAASWGKALSQNSQGRLKPCFTLTLEEGLERPKTTAEVWCLLATILHGSLERRKYSHQGTLGGQGSRMLTLSLNPNSPREYQNQAICAMQLPLGKGPRCKGGAVTGWGAVIAWSTSSYSMWPFALASLVSQDVKNPKNHINTKLISLKLWGPWCHLCYLPRLNRHAIVSFPTAKPAQRWGGEVEAGHGRAHTTGALLPAINIQVLWEKGLVCVV